MYPETVLNRLRTGHIKQKQKCEPHDGNGVSVVPQLKIKFLIANCGTRPATSTVVGFIRETYVSRDRRPSVVGVGEYF